MPKGGLVGRPPQPRGDVLSVHPSSSPGDGPVGPTAFWALILVYLPLRLWLATLPGYAPDLDYYKRGAIGAARFGMALAYEMTDFDYPPLFLYVLYPIGTLGLWLAGDGAMQSPLFTFMIKAPYLVFDLLVAWMILRLVSSGLWGPARAGGGWARLAALAYLWNPALLWATGYSGFPDQIHTGFALLALALVARQRWAYSGAMLAAGGLMKPLIAPLVPLLGLLAMLRARLRGVVAVTAAGLGVAIVAFLPWVLTGRGMRTVRQVLLDFDIMPHTTVHAHNLWWMLGGPQPANTPLIGPLTPTVIGLGMFGLALAALMLRSRAWILAPGKPTSEFASRLFTLAAAVSALYFFLTTHLHENHLFLTLGLLLCVAGRSRGLVWLTAGCSVSLLLNMALHDLELPYLLPLGLSAESPVFGSIFDRPFTWLQLIGGSLNAALVGAVTLGSCVAVWRLGAASDPPLAPAGMPVPQRRAGPYERRPAPETWPGVSSLPSNRRSRAERPGRVTNRSEPPDPEGFG
jgi:hypothetical protein